MLKFKCEGGIYFNLKGVKMNTKFSELKTFVVAGLCMAMICCVTVMLAGCGGTNIAGTWVVDRIVDNNTTIKPDSIDKAGHENDFLNEIKLNEDKTGTIKLGEATAQNCTWVQDGNKITLTYNTNNTLILTVANSEITTEEGDEKIFYKMKST